jgi:IS5 family transposase
MRKRFEQQLSLGQIPIEQTYVNPKRKYVLDELLLSLKTLYCTPNYNEKIFRILEEGLGKHRTGRKGMDLWCIFVLAQVRFSLNISYEMLHNLANNHRAIRQLMGVEREFGHEPFEFEYQTLYENVSAVSNELLDELNDVMRDFGLSEVFRKRRKGNEHAKEHLPEKNKGKLIDRFRDSLGKLGKRFSAIISVHSVQKTGEKTGTGT